VAHGPWKKPLDFGDSLDHVMVMVKIMVRWEHCHTAQGIICYLAFVQ